MLLIILSLALAVVTPACKSKEKVAESPVQIVIDVPPIPPRAKESDDPKGLAPVPESALGPDGPNDPEMLDDTACQCCCPSPSPSPTPEPTPEPTPTPVVVLKPGTVLSLKAGNFVVLGLASEVPSGMHGHTTYTTIKDGIQYRIYKQGVPPKAEDYQEDPNVFATSKLPLGVKAIVASGRLTNTQIASLKMENILSLFTYKNPDGGPGYHKDMAYMLQRFIAEGYLHGVSIIPIIKAQSHKLVLQVRKISEYTVEPNGLAAGETVSLSTKFWTSAPFYSRLRTFYHELAHALLERGHICGNTLMHYPKCSTARPFPRGDNYDPIIKEIYDPTKWGRLEGGAKPYGD